MPLPANRKLWKRLKSKHKSLLKDIKFKADFGPTIDSLPKMDKDIGLAANELARLMKEKMKTLKDIKVVSVDYRMSIMNSMKKKGLGRGSDEMLALEELVDVLQKVALEVQAELKRLEKEVKAIVPTLISLRSAR